MTQPDIPNYKTISETLNMLRSRRPNTKYRLVELLLEMGNEWHSFEKIGQSAVKNGVIISHLFENLIELCRISGFVETDFKEKRRPKASSFRILSEAFPLLKKSIEEQNGK